MPSKFGQGVDDLEQGAKGGPQFARSFYFGIEDGESAIVRFITDANPGIPGTPNAHLEGWINVQQHTSVDTKPKPAWHDQAKKWPLSFGVVCRDTKCKGIQGEPLLWTVMEDKEHEGCYVCQHMKKPKDGKPYRSSARGWALGCLREATTLEDGRQGYRDMVREVERDGQVVRERDIRIFNMGWRNFFAALAGYAKHYGTVVDRDYKVTRLGGGLDTQYQFIPMPEAEGYDLRDPEVFKLYNTDLSLDDEIEQQARWEWMRRWFDPTWTPPERTEGGSNGTATPEAAKPANDVAPDQLDGMAQRVVGRYSPVGSEVPQSG